MVEVCNIQHDIDNFLKIKTNAKRYIQFRKLRKKGLRKKIDENDLPIQSNIGSLFLIKGNNIIEFYAYIDPCTSIYLTHSVTKKKWIGTVNKINISDGDPHNLHYTLKYCDRVHYRDSYKYLITSLYNDGFEMYVI